MLNVIITYRNGEIKNAMINKTDLSDFAKKMERDETVIKWRVEC